MAYAETVRSQRFVFDDLRAVEVYILLQPIYIDRHSQVQRRWKLIRSEIGAVFVRDAKLAARKRHNIAAVYLHHLPDFVYRGL